MRNLIYDAFRRLIYRELRSGSEVLWDAVRSGVYAPFMVSTGLLLSDHLAASDWTWITTATIFADGLRRSVKEGVKAVTGNGDDEDDNDEE